MGDIEFKRVRYEKSPLIEVIFQLRFPTILSINSLPPVEFQEKIRAQYPFYNEQIEKQGAIFFNPQIEATSLQKTAENKNYAFVSEDNQVKINLTPSFMAISTMRYTQWEDFKKHIDFVVPVFEEIYKPAFYTRIGLRYTDIITRSDLGLEEFKWTDLMKPHVLGMITPEQENGVKAYLSETEYETIIPGILSKAHFEFVHVDEKTEISLLIDCDYYDMEITKLSMVNEKAELLHKASSQFIQKAITKKLHNAMQPVEIII